MKKKVLSEQDKYFKSMKKEHSKNEAKRFVNFLSVSFVSAIALLTNFYLFGMVFTTYISEGNELALKLVWGLGLTIVWLTVIYAQELTKTLNKDKGNVPYNMTPKLRL